MFNVGVDLKKGEVSDHFGGNWWYGHCLFCAASCRPSEVTVWTIYDTDWHQSNFLLSDVPTMPIVDKLKEALKPGRKETGDEGDLNKLLASSAKKVLLQKIEFEPASKGFSYQLDSLKNKYVILNPRNEGATCQKATEPAQIKRQGRISNWTGNLSDSDSLSFLHILPYQP